MMEKMPASLAAQIARLTERNDEGDATAVYWLREMYQAIVWLEAQTERLTGGADASFGLRRPPLLGSDDRQQDVDQDPPTKND